MIIKTCEAWSKSSYGLWEILLKNHSPKCQRNAWSCLEWHKMCQLPPLNDQDHVFTWNNRAKSELHTIGHHPDDDRSKLRVFMKKPVLNVSEVWKWVIIWNYMPKLRKCQLCMTLPIYVWPTSTEQKRFLTWTLQNLIWTRTQEQKKTLNLSEKPVTSEGSQN